MSASWKIQLFDKCDLVNRNKSFNYYDCKNNNLYTCFIYIYILFYSYFIWCEYYKVLKTRGKTFSRGDYNQSIQFIRKVMNK